MQVFGDGTRAVHLFERDCSLQRRHQKVIEEAPAPGMTEDMRAAMGQAAVRAAEAIGYKGAGTVEFIVDGSDGLRTDGFWFMEMNTRLQVEHPVTEVITGFDLVSWQLLVASGAPLPVTQDELRIMGHSFEARLYAEDVPAGFLPATGRIDHLSFPRLCRADSGVRSGDVISPYYDPMIAKIVVHGVTREAALQKLSTALSQTQVAGTVTNLAFLGALAGHAGFGRGEVDTGLIGREIEALTAPPDVTRTHVIAAGMAALGLDAPAQDAGFALWAPLRQQVTLRRDGTEWTAHVSVTDPQTQSWEVDGAVIEVVLIDGRWRIGDIVAPQTHMAGGFVTVFDAYGLAFEHVDPLDRATGAAGDGNLIEAPMPGLVKAMTASVGQAVVAGDRLAVLEAMKMEHALLAARDGVVAEVLAATGDQVEAGAALIRLEPQEAET